MMSQAAESELQDKRHKYLKYFLLSLPPYCTVCFVSSELEVLLHAPAMGYRRMEDVVAWVVEDDDMKLCANEERTREAKKYAQIEILLRYYYLDSSRAVCTDKRNLEE